MADDIADVFVEQTVDRVALRAAEAGEALGDAFALWQFEDHLQHADEAHVCFEADAGGCLALRADQSAGRRREAGLGFFIHRPATNGAEGEFRQEAGLAEQF